MQHQDILNKHHQTDLGLGSVQADLTREGYSWTRKTSAADLFKPGDLIDVQIVKLDDAASSATVTLEQTPLAEAAPSS